jgi:FlaA1/EpsC-like NDP-sugar epimerase
MRGAPGNASKNLLFIVDIFLILSAINLAVTLRLGKVVVLTYYTGATVFVTFSYLLCFYVFDLYNLKAKTYDAPGLTRYLVAVFSGTGIAAVIFYSFSHWKFGRGIVILTAFFVFVLTYLWRLIFEYFFVSKEKKKKVIIAGAGSSGRAMYNILKENELCDIKGFVDDAPDNKNKEIGKCGVIGGSEMISRLAGRNEIDMVVVAITHEKKKKLISALLEAKLKGVGVYDMQIMYEKITGKLPVNHLREGWLAYLYW